VDGEDVVLEVADTGIGIALDDLGRIGTPFLQVQSKCGGRRDGTGLGLSIVKALVDLHGGELKAESRPGEGTRMVVRLPLQCAARLRRPIPIAGIRDERPNGPWDGLPASSHVPDLSPDEMNVPANLPLPVQRRA